MSRLVPLSSVVLLPALLLSSGCPVSTDADDGVARGGLAVCVDGGRPFGEDQTATLTGTVTEITEGDADCGTQITVDDGDAAVHTFGVRALDADLAEDAPALALDVGATVSVLYQYKLVWGDVAGLVITDDAGVVLAAEEGGWGGALEAGDVPGLTVTRGDEVVATEATDCMPIEGFSLSFVGDDTVELVPVAEDTLTLGGAEVTARAVAAWDYGHDSSCQVSDTTGYTSWIVYR